jgi:hypothetical protein
MNNRIAQMAASRETRSEDGTALFFSIFVITLHGLGVDGSSTKYDAQAEFLFLKKAASQMRSDMPKKVNVKSPDQKPH